MKAFNLLRILLLSGLLFYTGIHVASAANLPPGFAEILIGQDLDPTNLDFGLVNDSEAWLKSGTQLFYSLDAGKQWRKINPETNLIEPYMLVSFPEPDLGFSLYLTQTETTIELEMHKTTNQGESWSQIEGDLEMQLKQQFSQPFGDIQMQWLDKKNAFILVKEFTSSNFSIGTLFVTKDGGKNWGTREAVSYTHLRAHETVLDLVCRLLLEKKNN